MEGKTALGASSPAKPALHMPEPLSTTRAAASSSHILTRLVWTEFQQRTECLTQGGTAFYILVPNSYSKWIVPTRVLQLNLLRAS